MLPKVHRDVGEEISIRLSKLRVAPKLATKILNASKFGRITTARLQVLSILCGGLIECIQIKSISFYECKIRISKNRRIYTKKFSGIRLSDMSWGISYLLKMGLIVYHRGYLSKEGKGYMTAIYPTEQFKGLLTQYNIPNYNTMLMRHPSISSKLVLVNKTNYRYTYTYKPSRGFLLFSNCVSTDLPNLPILLLHKSDIQSIRIPTNHSCFPSRRLSCRLQQLSKVERQSIQIDGHCTVEYDYQSTFPQIAYDFVGLHMKDPYSISNYPKELVKPLVLAYFTCENTDKFRKSVQSVVNKSNGQLGLAVDLANAIIEKHQQVRDQLSKTESAKQLHYYESEIALDVMYSIVKLGKPIIGIHDSFLVKIEDGDLLKVTMRTSYISVLKRLTNGRYAGNGPVINVK